MTKNTFTFVSSICCLFGVLGLTIQHCPAGFYCRKEIQRSRSSDSDYFPTPCPLGTFSDVGQYDCTPCEPGYYANSTGSASCAACPPGHMCPIADQNPVPCALGSYSSCTGQTCCSACAIGSYTPRVGSVYCINCPAGVRCPTSTASICG